MNESIAREIESLRDLTVAELREKYAEVFGEETRSRHKDYLRKRIAWRLQANAEGGLSERALRRARELANEADLRLLGPTTRTVTGRITVPKDRRLPMPGTVLTREYRGQTIAVTVLDEGFEYAGEGLPVPVRGGPGGHRDPLERATTSSAWPRREAGDEAAQEDSAAPSTRASPPTRAWTPTSTPSTPSGRRREAYIASQKHEGWTCLPDRYDDGGFSGGNMDRPALSGSWPTSRPGGSTASWSTRSTA